MSQPQTFSYHRSVAPMLWVLVAVGSVELTIVHLLVAMWSPEVAAVLSVATLATLVWLVLAIRGFRRLPVLLDRETLVLRTGRLRRVDVEVAAIAAVSGEVPRAELKARGAANFALVAHPNVVLTLGAPVRWRGRDVTTLAHRFDDAPAFLHALAAIRGTA